MVSVSPLREVQLNLISNLKKQSYQALKALPEKEGYPLPVGFECFELYTLKTVLDDGTVSIAVKLINNTAPPELPSWLKGASEDIEIGSRSSVDGFDIMPNGTIIPMHDDEHDPLD